MAVTVDECRRGAEPRRHRRGMLYSSDSIQYNREPEPSGDEGLPDVRIVQAQSASRD